MDRHLIEVLQSLTSEEWDLQTIAPQWKVRFVAAQLLDTALRKLSLVRNSWFIDNTNVHSPEDVVALVNRLNGEGVAMYRRLSPSVLIDQMTITRDLSASVQKSLDPIARATFNVSWAGEEVSLNWFNTAREFTERRHHQEQIRLATARPSIMTRDFIIPCWIVSCAGCRTRFAIRMLLKARTSYWRFQESAEERWSWHRASCVEQQKARHLKKSLSRKFHLCQFTKHATDYIHHSHSRAEDGLLLGDARSHRATGSQLFMSRTRSDSAMVLFKRTHLESSSSRPAKQRALTHTTP